MNHQQVEQWIFEPQKATREQLHEMELHLQSCPACQAVQAGWKEALVELKTTRLAEPAAGFTARWKEKTVNRASREMREQSWRLFYAFTGVSVLIGLLIAGYFAATVTPLDFAQFVVNSISFFLMSVVGLKDAFRVWLQNSPIWWTLPVMVMSALSLTALVMVWATMIKQVFAGEGARI